MINNNFKKSTLFAYSTAQTVPANGIVGLANSNSTGCSIDLEGNSINLLKSGLYLVNVSVSGTATAVGDIVIQLFQNGVAVLGATASETATATTSISNLSFSAIIDVNPTCNGSDNKTLTLVNTGVPTTLTNATITVVKLA